MPTPTRTPTRWTEPELMKALSLYRQIPFGRMHRSAPEIIALAAQLGRTPSSVAMKLSNFASLDPELTARGIAGLKGASKLDRQMWQQYANDWTELATALILPELASDQRKDDLFSPPPFPTGEVVEQSEDRRGSESPVGVAGQTPSGVEDSATSPAGSGGGESRIPLKEGEKDHKGERLPATQDTSSTKGGRLPAAQTTETTETNQLNRRSKKSLIPQGSPRLGCRLRDAGRSNTCMVGSEDRSIELFADRKNSSFIQNGTMQDKGRSVDQCVERVYE
jgi:hypothetical protein